MNENLAQAPRHPWHEHGDASERGDGNDPECACYVAGWESGFKAGQSDSGDDDEDAE